MNTEAAEPQVLTIEEAAAILRIGRNAAYAAARLWRLSGGSEGLPCIEIGRALRVPRAALHQLLSEPRTAPRSEPSSPAA